MFMFYRYCDGLYWLVSIPLWFGRLNIKPKKDALFSERNKLVPTFAVGPLLLVWRSRRRITSRAEDEAAYADIHEGTNWNGWPPQA